MPGYIQKGFTSFKAVVCALVIFSGTIFNVSADEAQVVPASPALQLLQRMVQAHQTQGYVGRFTYEHGGVLRAMEVEYRFKDGAAVERLTHLNGPQREMVRHQPEKNCQTPSEALMRGKMLDLGEGDYTQLTDNYELVLKGQDRVAGRLVDVLHLVAKDKNRYGYSLAIDSESGVLMQSLLIDSSNKVLERFQFISLTLLEPENAEVKEQFPRVNTSTCLPEGGFTLNKPWRLGWLPAGFTLSNYQAAEEDMGETFVYSDGLAVFSVFIQPEGVQALPEVQAQRGATVAFLMHKSFADELYRVCIVGEIPPVAARKIAQSLILQEN